MSNPQFAFVVVLLIMIQRQAYRHELRTNAEAQKHPLWTRKLAFELATLSDVAVALAAAGAAATLARLL